MSEPYLNINISIAEIEQLYGNRIRSRMREFFDLIPFDNSVKDKRK